ncbi:HAD family hydrolase [Flavobacterium psychrotrophum]|uniref:HAD family hydrolase n=1 Tax=Flavobacterium psychrotrophum TaxID=2294119 RepID=UPI000E31CF92|nr:HAD family phosphatase [Flavobacterium psychrotrophum]
MLKAVIFDMDGVVINSEPVSYRADKELFRQLELDVPDAVYASFVGTAPHNNMQKLKELYDISLTQAALLDKRYKVYFDVFDKATDLELMPGVLEFISELRQKGIKVLLATSAIKAKIERVFKRFNLDSYFDAVISGEDFEFSKPHPAIFLEAVNRTGYNKNECIIIEDSTNGIAAAKAAGVYCVAYESPHGLPQDTGAADKIITDFRELISMF